MKLHARFKTGSFVKGLELVNRISEAAEEANHHPDVVLTYPQVDVDLVSHDVGGVTSRDLDLARRISAIAAELGVEAAPRESSTLELALDVPDADEVRPFWAAVLGYEPCAASGPRSTTRAAATTRCGSRRPPTRPARSSSGSTSTSSCRARSPRSGSQAALDAGGTLVSTADVPAFWVLADQHGNKVCVCTADGREPTP